MSTLRVDWQGASFLLEIKEDVFGIVFWYWKNIYGNIFLFWIWEQKDAVIIFSFMFLMKKEFFQIGFFIFDAKKFTNCFFIFCFYIVFIFYIVIKFIIEFYFEANDFYSFCESNFYSLIIIFSRDIFIKDIFQSKKFL